MTTDNRRQRIQDMSSATGIDLLLSLYWRNTAWIYGIATIKRSFDDEETTLFYNYSVGFIDDNSLCTGSASSPGSQTIATWKDAAGASDLSAPEWCDTSGNGNHLTQGTSADQPKLILNGAGVLADMTFDGVDDYLFNNDFETWNSPSMVFSVAQKDGVQVFLASIFASSGTTGDDTFQKSYTSDLRLRLRLDDSLGGQQGVTIDETPDDNIHLYTAQLDGISNIKTYTDGVQENNSDVGDGFLGKYARYQIGASRGASDFFKGTISEIIVAKNDNESKRLDIERELKTSYGIS